MCMYMIRVILIWWVGIDHPVYYFTLLLKLSAQTQLEKTIAFATPQAPAPQKNTEGKSTLGSNQRLEAHLNPSTVLVSHTV